MQHNSKQQLQVTKLEQQLKAVRDETIKKDIQKKLDIIKSGKPVTK